MNAVTVPGMIPYLSIILAAAVFGSSGIFIKKAGLPVTTMAFFRMVVPFAAISLAFLIRKKPWPSLKDRPMVLASFLNGLRLVLYFAGYAFGDISTSVILLYTWPVFATFWSCLFLGETLSLRRLALFATTFSGVALILMNKTLTLSDQRLESAGFILASALIYSMTVVIFKKNAERYSPFETLWFQNCLGTFAFFPFLLLNRPVPLIWQAGLGCGYGLVVGILGFGLFFYGLRRVEASRASFLTYVEVVSGICFGMVFYDERLTWNILAGGSLVLLSALALSRK